MVGALRCIAVSMFFVSAAGIAVAPAAAQAKAAAKSAWVKVCDRMLLTGQGRTETQSVCLTHHERIDANTGLVLVSAAIRQVEGQPLPNLMVMVPTGMALQAGVQIKIDGEQTIHKLKYTLCHPAGCAAEAEATPALIAKMQSAKQMIVAAMNPNGRAVGFPVPLTGFREAYKGRAMDPQKYATARKNLMALVRKRQADAAEKVKN